MKYRHTAAMYLRATSDWLSEYGYSRGSFSRSRGYTIREALGIVSGWDAAGRRAALRKLDAHLRKKYGFARGSMSREGFMTTLFNGDTSDKRTVIRALRKLADELETET